MYDQNLRTRMATMSPQQLKQFAMMHKDDPFVVSMALDIDNTRKAGQRQQAMQAAQQPQPKVVDQTLAAIGQPEMPSQDMQAAPQMQAGLPQVPAQNIANMADGGIAGYAKGGETNELEQYVPRIVAEAKRLGIDPNLALRLFKTESEGKKGAVSHKGAAGLGQLMKPAAKEMGISEEERFDPEKNITASLGYLKKQLDKYKDPVKAVAAYNWGPGNVDKHLAKNQGAINPIGLPKETANYITKLIPIAAANAAEERPTAKAGEFFPPNMLNPDIGKTMIGAPVEGIAKLQGGRYSAASVPGTPEAIAADKARAATLAKAEKETTLMDKIYGGAEALHGLALGYPAMATGLINLPSVQNFLAPKTEKGKEYSADLHKLLVEEGKLPPFIPSLGVSKPTALTPEAAARAAEATRRAETAAVNAETAAAPRLPAPAKGGPKADVLAGYRTNPATGEVVPRWATEQTRTFDIAPESAEFGALSVRDRLLRDQAADVVKAKEEAARLGEKADVAGDEVNAARLLDEQNTGIQRLQTNAPKPITALGSSATTMPVTPDEEAARTKPHLAYSEEPGFDFSKPEKAGEVPIEERGRTAIPEKKTGFGALSDEDYLMMGLNMLQAPAGLSGGMLSQLGQNIGRSGLATLGAKREREKTLADQLQKQALSDYYKGMTKNLEREPEQIRFLESLRKNPELMDTYLQMEQAKDITGQRARLVDAYKNLQLTGSPEANMPLEQFLKKYGGISMGSDMFSLSPKGMEAFKKYGG